MEKINRKLMSDAIGREKKRIIKKRKPYGNVNKKNKYKETSHANKKIGKQK
jgi:hypothetical protein